MWVKYDCVHGGDVTVREGDPISIDGRTGEVYLGEVPVEDSPVVPLIFSRNSFLHGSGVTNFVIGEFPAYPNYLTVTLG